MKTETQPAARSSAHRMVRRIRAGLYELVGAYHQPNHRGLRPCDGRILCERVEPSSRMTGEEINSDPVNYRWEAYCETCKACDPNGWPTLREANKESRRYFAPDVKADAREGAR